MSDRLISHLAHVELLTPRPEQSLSFFEDVIGLSVSRRDESSVYLRAWGEWSLHSLQLTAAPAAGLGHIGWRAASADDLEQAAARLERAGAGVGWIEDSVGHGRAFRYRGPGGHLHEIFWELDRHEAPAGSGSTFPDRPERFAPRGCYPRQIDHVTVMTPDTCGDARWHQEQLGSRFMEWTAFEDDVAVFAMSTNCEKSHDLGLVLEDTQMEGRLHHLAYWVDSSVELHRAADILLEQGVPIEFGPGRHGMGEQDYLYFREPGGNRIEINTGGYRNYVPDWEPVKWTPAEGSLDFYRNLQMPESMLEGTPPAPGDDGGERLNPWAATSVH
jgi:catechol 2,3-dioxygenase